MSKKLLTILLVFGLVLFGGKIANAQVASNLVPTCVPRPVCLDAVPACNLPELASYCPKYNIQSYAEYALGSEIGRVLIKDNQMWTKSYPQSGVGVDWTVWSGPFAIDTFPGKGEIQAFTQYPMGTDFKRVLIRGDQMWTQTYTVGNASTTAWNGPFATTTFPGVGEIQSFSEYPMGTDMQRVLIRNNQMWTKTYPQSGLNVKWEEWNGPFAITTFPGVGVIQSFTQYPKGSDFVRVLIRGDQMWTKTYPQSGLNVKWEEWNGPFLLNTLPKPVSTLTPSPILSITPSPTMAPTPTVVPMCEPRPECLDSVPSCNMPELSTYCPKTAYKISSFVEYAVGSNINRVMIKNNQMWTKSYPQSGVGVDWTAWNGPYALSSFPGTGTIYGYSESPVGTNINRVLIRGSEMWTKSYPQSGIGVDWTIWNGPWAINTFPGTGEIQSFTEYALGTNFVRVLLRGNQMWTKSYPQSGIGVDWTIWNGPWAINSFPGTGEIQSFTEYPLGTNLVRVLLRGDQMWTKTYPQSGTGVEWTVWNGPYALTTLPNFPDANGDGIVDLADFDRWKREYLGILTTKTANFNPSIDDVVDLADFDIWKRSYLAQ